MKGAGNIVWQVSPLIFWIIVGVSLGLLAFLWLQAWSRQNKKYRIARISMSFFMVLALGLLGLKPAWQTQQKSPTALLLSSGYAPQILDSLQKTLDSILVFRYGTTTPSKTLTKKAIKVHDAAFIARNYPQIAKIHLIGNGLPAYELPSLEPYHTQFHLNAPPTGFQEVTYPKQSIAQEDFIVKGTYQIGSDSSVTLLLSNPGGITDSVLINTKSPETFTLKDKPKEAGRYVYHLIVKNTQGDTLNNEPVPVEIQPQRKLNVVIINHFPRFETKYLKNWLAEQGHQVAVRSIISKNKVKDEFANQTAISFQLTPRLLQQIDILIMDATYAQNLGAGTLATLQKAVKTQGLGVLIQADESGNVPVTLAKFPLGQTDQDKALVNGPDFGIKGSYKLTQLPYLLQQRVGTLALVNNTQGQTLVGYNINGLGAVGISLIEESYQMLLDGKPNYYTAYWTHILNQLAKKQRPINLWKINTIFPLMGEKCDITLNTSLPKPIGEITDIEGNAEFYLQNQLDFPQKWQGSIWPKQAGWHQLGVKNDTTGTTPLYIFAEKHWKNWRIRQQIMANKQWAQKHKDRMSLEKKQPLSHQQSIPLGYFFGLFLLSTGFLWLEPKL